MCTLTRRRLGLCAALAVALSPLVFALAGAAPEPAKTEYYKGKVVPLAGLLEKFGSRLDADAAPHWLALVTDDGKTYPLIQDDGARMFFKDAKLLNRPMRLTARPFQDTHLLQVLEVHSYLKAELHEVFYWCDICSIKRYEKKICDCCGGPMVLKEEPLPK
jgi:hypothetical protein